MYEEINDISEVIAYEDVLPFLGTLPDSVQLTFGKAELLDEEDEFGIPKLKTATAVFSFSEKGYGFGDFVIKTAEDGRTYIDSECTDADRIKRYLCALVDNAIFDWDEDPERHALYHKAMGLTGCGRCQDEQADQYNEMLEGPEPVAPEDDF